MSERLIFKSKYTIPALIVTTLLFLTLWKWHSDTWALIATALYLYFFGYHLGKLFLPNQRKGWQICFGGLGLIQLIIIPLSVIYWFFHISPSIITVLLVAIPILLSLIRVKEKEEDWIGTLTGGISETISSYLGTKMLTIILIGSFAVTLLYLASKNYGDTLISPWTIVGNKFFLLVAILLLLELWVVQVSKHQISNLFLSILQYGIFLWVALFLFKYGFGFDPFIHQATEKWIAAHGSITPKVPYYIGQYVLTVFLHETTRLSIEMIDKILVPVGAAIFIPLFAYFSFSRKKLDTSLLPGIVLLPFIPLSFFTFTTPNNLALLLAALLAFWIWYEEDHRTLGTTMLGLLLVGGSLAIHPLIGVPLAVIYITALTCFKTKTQPRLRALVLIFFGIILAIILPATFWLNALRQGQPLALQNPLQHLTQFLSLFQQPTWYFFDKASWLWKLLYWYKICIMPAALVIAGFGMRVSVKKYHSALAWFGLMTTVALTVSAFILATSIHFADVISYEQNAFGERTLQLALVFLLPFFLLGIRELFLAIRERAGRQFFISAGCAGLLLISWYFTYPTRDPVSMYTGYNVRDADIAAVKFIDARAKSNCVGADSPPPSPCRGGLGWGLEDKRDYIVLANQVIGVTALHEFGFVKYFDTLSGGQYFYSIPTGGALYQYFRKMVYEHPKREWMNEAMDYMGVKKAYFVHTNYWYPAAQIRDEAKVEANQWWDIGNGRVWVYEYMR